jgi:hypothetical protein
LNDFSLPSSLIAQFYISERFQVPQDLIVPAEVFFDRNIIGVQKVSYSVFEGRSRRMAMDLFIRKRLPNGICIQSLCWPEIYKEEVG